MSSTSKIATAIIVAGIIIAGAVLWAGRNKETAQVTNTQVENTAEENKAEEALPAPAPGAPNTPSESAPKELAPMPAAPASFETALPTGSWVVASVKLNGQVKNLNENIPQPLTLLFNTKTKQVSGFAGCNSFAGSYKAAAGTTQLSFIGLALGKKNCGPQAVELTLIQAMNLVTNYSIKNGQLVLASANSSTELVYDQAK